MADENDDNTTLPSTTTPAQPVAEDTPAAGREPAAETADRPQAAGRAAAASSPPSRTAR